MRKPWFLARPDSADERAAVLARWNKMWTPWVIVSAVIPLFGVTDPSQGPVVTIVGVATWLVFLVDLLIHLRLIPHYLHSRAGKLDLGIVVITAPVYLFFGSSGGLAVLARFARIARILWLGLRKAHGAKRLLDRLGRVAIYAGALTVGCAVVVYWTEPASSGFATMGDSLWWAMVTLTTVGYGDLYPVGTAGRIAACILMLGGVAFLGVLAAALAAFFGFGSGDSATATPATEDDPSVASDVAAQVALLKDEIAQLRATLDRGSV
ncbi:MAG: potassium channel family protein [Actinomycetes bacterium]